jgi:chemotaxis protein methyltransferase CheR
VRTEVVPEVIWPRLSELIADRTGLHFPPERHRDLQRALQSAAAEFGFADSARCAEWLLSTPLSRSQLQTLASHLTIGETYFFREPQTFDALSQHILPALIQRRRGRDQRLRLWSAACSTGEEPYSLAILVRQLLPDWPDWHVRILATDINEGSLQKAAAGVYGEWSFRQSPAGFKEQYFTPAKGGRFALLPQVRDCVSFVQLNLAGDSFPSLATDTNAMDVILCRNLLIYFTPAHARKLVESLHHALMDEAWLAVSPSECSQVLFSQFTAVNFPGSVLYRKGRGEPLSPPRWTPAPAPAPVSNRAPLFEAPQRQEPIAPAETPDLPEAADGPRKFSLLTRALANQGRLPEALTWSERWIAADKIDPVAHYVHAMILGEQGERDAARRSLNRAVYLQPEFALAHFALGNLARGDARSEANRHFENALRLLRAHPPDQPLPESDGLDAGRLVEIITTILMLTDRAGARPS